MFSVVFRESLDKLSQRGQLLSEEGHGAGKEGRLCSQLLTSYQGLVRMTKEKLRSCQAALQEHEALEEALQSMWAWVKGVQDKLACADSTVGSKDALEKRLLQIQVPAAPARHPWAPGLMRLDSQMVESGPNHAVSLSLNEDSVSEMGKLGRKDLEGMVFPFVKERDMSVLIALKYIYILTLFSKYSANIMK